MDKIVNVQKGMLVGKIVNVRKWILVDKIGNVRKRITDNPGKKTYQNCRISVSDVLIPRDLEFCPNFRSLVGDGNTADRELLPHYSRGLSESEYDAHSM